MTKFKLGLKGSVDISQIENRLSQEGLAVFEFHLNEDDLFGQKYKELQERIMLVQNQGVKVFLHHPMKIHGELLNLNAPKSKISEYFLLSTRILVELCEQFDIYVVVHMNYGDPEDTFLCEDEYANKEAFILSVHNMLRVNELYGKGRILWENGVLGVGAYREDMMLANIIAGTSIKLCFDVSHACLSLKGDNEKLFETITILEPNIQYYHVVDTLGLVHDSLIIGDGVVDFQRIYPFITARDYIYEIGLAELNDCAEMVESHRRFEKINLKNNS